MDLNSLEKKSDTTTVELYNPLTNTTIMNEDGTPMTVTVHGMYSKTYRSIAERHQNARLKRAQRGGKVQLSAQEITNDRVELVVGCVDSWNITLDGERPDCTAANVKAVFDRLPWVRDQIEVALEDVQAFLTT